MFDVFETKITKNPRKNKKTLQKLLNEKKIKLNIDNIFFNDKKHLNT